MLFGLQVPYYGVYNSTVPLNVWDAVGSILAISGIVFVFIADNQLRAYSLKNRELVEAGQPKVMILKTGLWKYSRHPNHFGE